MTPESARLLAERAIEMAEKCPPGPWNWNHVGDNCWREAPHGEPHYGARLVFSFDEIGEDTYQYPLGKFIAEARTALPELARYVLETTKP